MLPFITIFLIFGTSAYALPSVSRIVGGALAHEGQFAYQVSVQIGRRNHLCGGSIIAPNTILTAAHCTFGRTPEEIVIAVGSTQIEGGDAVYHEVETIINHEHWNPDTIANDISLLKLKVAIVLGDDTEIVELETTEVEDGALGIVSGWGLTSPNGEHSNDLLYIESAVINYKECLIKLNGDDTLQEFNICGANSYQKGTCQQDSGGPYVVNEKQVGIVSWGLSCANNMADVYTKVSYYIDWINQHL
ncbi:hypothetical protein FQA39_LY16593 [Lamprigera yunnana]|nr:hypothetical protein FQA39_LY16593 [Lamprigera yunnana]